MKEAAIFDIDKTLVKGNAGQKYVMHLFRRGMIGPINAIRINYSIFKYLINSSNYDDAMKKAYSVTKGWDAEKIRKIIERYYHKKIHKLIYPEMRRIIEEHRKKGRIIIFITNSWDAMAQNTADELKADILIATKVEIRDGKYTGKVIQPCFGEYKKEYLLKTAAEKDIDLKKSYAYSDHVSDIPMLKAVGHATAVNPDKNLLKVAKIRGWEILNLN